MPSRFDAFQYPLFSVRIWESLPGPFVAAMRRVHIEMFEVR